MICLVGGSCVLELKSCLFGKGLSKCPPERDLITKSICVKGGLYMTLLANYRRQCLFVREPPPPRTDVSSPPIAAFMSAMAGKN
ncbi:hypothetical protein J6590_071399 [Homalodisca vitripennis]|nr:hypothetical protein J6590_071399 [Homalodisca vitripennis]